MWRERVRIEQGDIAQVDSEAVVNAANSELWMGSGVAGALRKAGGSGIEREAVLQGPIGVGEAVITGAGSLKSLHVIHAAAMGPGRGATAESVGLATASALRIAAEHNIESVAFPALGTGVGGLGFAECAQAMLAAIEAHCTASRMPTEIRLVLFGDNALKVFEEELQSMMNAE